jgi:peptidoglycan/xylan/chitin deacetylase (PgdA/CDA1 family)
MDFDSPYASLASWPANHRAALIVLVHIDVPPMDGSSPAGPVGLDYTASGLQRLLTAFADLDIPVTTAWTSRAVSTLPQLARAASDAGHELALSYVGDSSENGWEHALDRVSEAPVSGCVGSLPLPAHYSEIGSLADGVSESMTWAVTGVGGDVPVITTISEGQDLAAIPVSPYWTDGTWLAPERPLPPSSLLEAWSLGLASVREEGGLMTVVLQPHISGRPGLTGQIVRFLDEVIECGDVWVATAGQVAEWWTRSGDHQD